jgi:hypothetical protein
MESAPVRRSRRLVLSHKEEEARVQQFIRTHNGSEIFGGVDLVAVRAFIKENRCVVGKRKTVTTKKVLQRCIMERFAVELSMEKVAELMGGLGFSWGHLRPRTISIRTSWWSSSSTTTRHT